MADYYQRDLALVHHLGFGFHADRRAAGILALLEPVRTRAGLVVELGCGSGLLTLHLLDAGHRVVAPTRRRRGGHLRIRRTNGAT